MQYLLSTGSNIGNRSENLARAVSGLQKSGASVVQASSIYDTSPWGFNAGETFFNQVLKLETDISPQEMMNRILKIEQQLGRIRSDVQGYQSRIIDIDILLVDDMIVSIEELVIPHPRMHKRRFVLVPAVEIASDWVHPVFNKTLRDLLTACSDKEMVVRI